MTGILVYLGLAVGVSGPADWLTAKQYRIEARLCQGDPLGSRQAGTVKYLAEPVLVTSSGRGASFWSGGQIPVRGPDGKLSYEPVGTRVEVLPLGYPDGRVRVELNITRREVNLGLGVKTAAGEVVPGFTEQQWRVAWMAAPGEPFRFRLAAESPADQTWVEVAVRELRPGAK
jgi:hypothetical protein